MLQGSRWVKRHWRWIAATCLLPPPFLIAFAFWSAARVSNESAVEVAARGQLPFIAQPVAMTPAAGVESIAAAADFRDVAALGDSILVSGRGGLYIYDAG